MPPNLTRQLSPLNLTKNHPQEKRIREPHGTAQVGTAFSDGQLGRQHGLLSSPFWLLSEQTIQTAKSAKATEESAKATRESIDLQKAALAQWVITDNWEGGAAHFSETDGYFMTIRFDIVNPTKFRLNLHSLHVSVLNGGSWGIRRPGERPDFLPPDGRYPVSINVRLKDAKRGKVGGTNSLHARKLSMCL